MKRLLAALGAALLVLVAVVLVRAALVSSRQPEVSPAPPLEIDANAVAQRLGLLLRYRSISYQDPARLDRDEFRALHRLLHVTYRDTHQRLERTSINDLSLVYEWPGSNPELRPVLLAAHLDVVPVDPETLDDWTHPPFEGVVTDGVVWGRGAIDDKGSIVAMLEAVEHLVEAGFEPERTVYLAFGHDEEVGGDRGAAAIAEWLESRGVRLEWALDEGGVIADSFLPGLDTAVAVIGVAEKGSVAIAMELTAPGGHSSTPPRHTAIGDLARALVRLEESPMPGGIDGVVAQFLDHLAPELPFSMRAVLANRWLFSPLLEIGFSRVRPLDAMLRTTTAITMFRAGVKENLLPARARAIANFRIHPRDTIRDVEKHVRRTLDDDRIALQVGVRSKPRNPSPLSPVDSQAFRFLRRSIRESFPGVVAVPYLVLGGTDGRHYYRVTPNVYRFGPYVLGSDALQRIHGTDERISAEALADAVRFYVHLIRSAAGPGGRGGAQESSE